MIRVNIASCDLGERLDRGVFFHRESSLGEPLGAKWIGASVYEAQERRPIWPYHYHHGVEEWMYVISGAPVLRDQEGERSLSLGDVVAFPSGELGAHTVSGPGRFVIFSVGARGWGEAFVTAYPDSDQIAAAPGVRFRRANAIDSWAEAADQTLEAPKRVRPSSGMDSQTAALATCTRAPGRTPGSVSNDPILTRMSSGFCGL